MIKKILQLTLWAGIFMSSSKQAQAQVWVGTIPTYYNPSFAGGAGGPRLSTFSHLQDFYNNVDSRHYLSFDHYISKIASGIGVNLEYNRWNTVAFFPPSHNYYYSAELIYAPKISINGKFTISPSVSAKLNHQNVQIPETIFNPGVQNVANHLHLGAGLLLNSKKFYLGYSIYHLADEIKGGRYSASPWTSMVQAGYTFQRSDDAKFAFTPQLLWINRHRFTPASDLLPAGATLNFRYKKLLFGTGYEPYQAISFMAGYQTNKLRVLLLIPSHISKESYGANISIRFLFSNFKKNQNAF